MSWRLKRVPHYLSYQRKRLRESEADPERPLQCSPGPDLGSDTARSSHDYLQEHDPNVYTGNHFDFSPPICEPASPTFDLSRDPYPMYPHNRSGEAQRCDDQCCAIRQGRIEPFLFVPLQLPTLLQVMSCLRLLMPIFTHRIIIVHSPNLNAAKDHCKSQIHTPNIYA